MLANSSDYLETLDQIKRDIAETRTRAVSQINAELVTMYWRIGKTINHRAIRGNEYLTTLSKDIRTAFPGIKGFSVRNMKYMTKFAREFSEAKCNSCCTLPWGHIIHLLDKTEPGDKRDWYVRASMENGWSRAVLDHQIDTHLYERQASKGKASNFSRTLPASQSEMAQQALKDPYIFDFITTRQDAKEREIEQAMTDNLTKLLLELGTGFSFVGRQFHLEVGQSDFYIDLLFYNIKLHCYVVVELKNEEFRPEFSGQLGFYVTAVDGELRDEVDNPTVGLLLCKTKDSAVAEYSLQSTASPIGISEYRLGDELPPHYAEVLPSTEDLMARI